MIIREAKESDFDVQMARNIIIRCEISLSQNCKIA